MFERYRKLIRRDHPTLEIHTIAKLGEGLDNIAFIVNARSSRTSISGRVPINGASKANASLHCNGSSRNRGVESGSIHGEMRVGGEKGSLEAPGGWFRPVICPTLADNAAGLCGGESAQATVIMGRAGTHYLARGESGPHGRSEDRRAPDKMSLAGNPLRGHMNSL